MPCEHYKDSLVEAAATGAEPQGELRAHLAACASCRSAFAQEQSLFASIDAGLYATANAEVPPSLLPHVRANLDEAVAPQRRWMQPLIFASASLALAILIFLMGRPQHTPPEIVAKQAPVVSAPTAPEISTNPQKVPTKDAEAAFVAPRHSRTTRNSTIPQIVASSKPEVLVPPDERVALARFVAMLNERSGAAAALLAPAPEKKDALVSVDLLQIAEIEVKPLEGQGSETPDRTEEKR
jgi:hypothetical protein